MKYRVGSALIALAFVASTEAGRAQIQEPGNRGVAGVVYTASNAAEGNAVLVFLRLADGQLQPVGSVPTEGLGTGAGLGNQGGLVFSRDERFLLVVNAGSNSVSVFDAQDRNLRLVDVEPTGGQHPVSVTEHRGVVYVLNEGSDNINGFRLGREGQLEPIAGSTRLLSGSGTDAAQIEFSPDGDVLVVTERATNTIVTFQVDRDGVAGTAQFHQSSGVTPFGFAFGKRDQLIVSEAFGGAPDGSAASSYELDRSGALTTVSGSVPTTETSACWVAITPSGRFAYTTNGVSGSISGYAIAFDGQIELLDDHGRTGVTGDGSGPNDVAISSDGQFLYSLNRGSSSIGAFRISADGSLTPLPFTGGLPATANGLAAR